MNYRPKLNDKGEIQIRSALPDEYYVGTMGKVTPNRSGNTTRYSYMIVEPIESQPRQEYVFKYVRTGNPNQGDYVYLEATKSMYAVVNPEAYVEKDFDIYQLMPQSPQDACRKLPSKSKPVVDDEYDDG